MIIEFNIFLCEQLISMFIMGCPGGKINMAAVSAKRSIAKVLLSSFYLNGHIIADFIHRLKG